MMLLLQQMLVLFLMMFIGWYCGKRGYLDDSSMKQVSWIVVNVANPALILSAGVGGERGIDGKNLVLALFVSVVLFAALIAVAELAGCICKRKVEDIGVYKAMLVFSNMGFMGFPLLEVMYGSEALLYGSLFLFPFNILIYSYGIRIMKKTKDRESFRIKSICNVGLAAAVISLCVYLADIPMPFFAVSVVEKLSSLTAPLSMMVIGHSLVPIKLKKLFTDVRLLVFSAVKLIVIPAVGILLLKIFLQDEVLLSVCFIILATPAASMTAMLAEQADGNSELAAKGVGLTTLLSVVTLPLVACLL